MYTYNKSGKNKTKKKKGTKEMGKLKQNKSISTRHKPSVICKASTAGITLIALVITIIILLILAGITINLTIGQDGILKRAQEAGKNYINAAEYENIQLTEFLNETDKIIENVTGGNNEPTIPALGTIIKTENNINYTADGIGNVIPIPVGFSPITAEEGQGTKETGFIIKNDNDNNEFVWVPVDDTTPYKYERVAFSKEGWKYTQTKGDWDSTSQSYKIIRADYPQYNFTETMPIISENRTELQSVTEYGGFYIGRYESGVIEYTGNVATNNSSNSTTWTGYTNGMLVVQKDKQVWNFITRDRSKTEAEKLYNKEKDNVTSRLCSSYAWDTALKFIEIKYPTYLTNSTQGNYLDKSATLGKPAKTGKTEAVNNIYDMGGNVYEWSTEVYSNTWSSCPVRGGSYDNGSSEAPATIRECVSTTDASGGIGFRITLYL